MLGMGTVWTCTFGHGINANHFAAYYFGGTLIMYDIESGSAIAVAEKANTNILASSMVESLLARIQ